MSGPPKKSELLNHSSQKVAAPVQLEITLKSLKHVKLPLAKNLNQNLLVKNSTHKAKLR